MGGKDANGAALVFHQAVLIALLCGAIVLTLGYLFAGSYMAAVAADTPTAAAGRTYLHYYLPGLAMQFSLVALAAGVRGTGIAKPVMLIQLASLALNAMLAPVLINGMLGLPALGVAGAGLARAASFAWRYWSVWRSGLSRVDVLA